MAEYKVTTRGRVPEEIFARIAEIHAAAVAAGSESGRDDRKWGQTDSHPAGTMAAGEQPRAMQKPDAGGGTVEAFRCRI